MKIARIKMEAYSRPFLKGVRQGFYLHIETTCGKKVTSESAPLPGFSVETLAQVFREGTWLNRHFKGFDLADFKLSLLLSFLPANAWALYSGFMELLEPEETPFSIPLCGYIDPSLIKSADDLIPLEPFSTVKVKLKDVSYADALHFFKTFAPFFKRRRVRLDGNLCFLANDVQALIKELPFLSRSTQFVEEPKGWKEANFSFPLALDESLRSHLITKSHNEAFWVLKPMLDFSLLLPLLEKKADLFRPQTVFSSSYETSVGIYHIAKLCKRLNTGNLAMGLDTLKLFSSPEKSDFCHVLINNGYLVCSRQLEKNYA